MASDDNVSQRKNKQENSPQNTELGVFVGEDKGADTPRPASRRAG